ncbi:hypothetical protein RhiJN_27289 [Ceratobasidium sp. AG-Ba]|nr:hypothetical protein RhiJN_27289 [Ceratobasidium sp. AG-Ba]
MSVAGAPPSCSSCNPDGIPPGIRLLAAGDGAGAGIKNFRQNPPAGDSLLQNSGTTSLGTSPKKASRTIPRDNAPGPPSGPPSRGNTPPLRTPKPPRKKEIPETKSQKE